MAEEIAQLRNSNSSYDVKQEKEREIRLSYNKRLKNLKADFERDERERMQNLKDSLRKTFGGTKELVEEFINNYATGTTDEVIRQYRHFLNKNPDTLPF
jgi:hypothetical protein